MFYNTKYVMDNFDFTDNYSAIEETQLIERCHNHASIWKECTNSSANITVYHCVYDALKHIKSSYKNNPLTLITGSLHLVGAALSILDPNLSSI